MKYVVDTSIVNKLVDGKIDPSELPTDGEFIASHIQIDELQNTKDADRRAQLRTRFVELGTGVVQTETIVFGTSKFGLAKFGDGITFNAPRAALDARNHGKKNNSNDALIAETAIKNGFTLLTADHDLKVVAESHVRAGPVLESLKLHPSSGRSFAEWPVYHAPQRRGPVCFFSSPK